MPKQQSTDQRKKQSEVIRLDSATQRALEQKIDQKQNAMSVEKDSEDEKSSTIFLGNIPKSFVEHVMKKFFNQFGSVTRLVIPKKKGLPCGYAFIEFADAIVAQIAADTMHGYIMFRRILRCKVVSQKRAARCFLVSRSSAKETVTRNDLEAYFQLRKSIFSNDKSNLTAVELKELERLISLEKERRAQAAQWKLNFKYVPVIQFGLF